MVLPTLKIIALKDLFLHKEPDPSRSEQLTDKFIQQGILRNPPIILSTKARCDRFMAMDGAVRVTAVRKLRISSYFRASNSK